MRPVPVPIVDCHFVSVLCAAAALLPQQLRYGLNTGELLLKREQPCMDSPARFKSEFNKSWNMTHLRPEWPYIENRVQEVHWV